jgi:hypothetical protein
MSFDCLQTGVGTRFTRREDNVISFLKSPTDLTKDTHESWGCLSTCNVVLRRHNTGRCFSSMAPWENAQSSSLPERKNSCILLQKTSEIRTLTDTGGRRGHVDFQVAVFCATFLKCLLPGGTGSFASSPCINILSGTSHITYIIRRLRLIGSWFVNSYQEAWSPFTNKTKSKRQCDSAKLLSLVVFIRACLLLASNSKGTALILISFFRRTKVYKETVPAVNTQSPVKQISERPLFMLHQHLKVLKRLHFSSVLFVNNLPFWFVCFSLDVSKIKQENFVSSATNKYLINYFATISIRKKLEGNKVRNLWIDFFYFCSFWLTLISDSGSTKRRIYQRCWKDLGIIHKYSSSANEGDVPCGQYKYNNIKDRRHSSYNTTCVLFVSSLYHLLSWRGNDQHGGTGPVATAADPGCTSVNTISANLLPLCLVMLASSVSSLGILLQEHLCSVPSREVIYRLQAPECCSCATIRHSDSGTCLAAAWMSSLRYGPSHLSLRFQFQLTLIPPLSISTYTHSSTFNINLQSCLRFKFQLTLIPPLSI